MHYFPIARFDLSKYTLPLPYSSRCTPSKGVIINYVVQNYISCYLDSIGFLLILQTLPSVSPVSTFKKYLLIVGGLFLMLVLVTVYGTLLLINHRLITPIICNLIHHEILLTFIIYLIIYFLIKKVF